VASDIIHHYKVDEVAVKDRRLIFVVKGTWEVSPCVITVVYTPGCIPYILQHRQEGTWGSSALLPHELHELSPLLSPPTPWQH
jgi:hypothetical protein